MLNVSASLVVGVGDVGRRALDEIKRMICAKLPSRTIPCIFRMVHVEAAAAAGDIETSVSEAYMMGFGSGAAQDMESESGWRLDRTRIETFIIAALDSASYSQAFAAAEVARARATSSISGTRTAIFMIARHRLALDAQDVCRTAAVLDSQVDSGPFTRYFFVDEVNESRQAIHAAVDVIEQVAAFVALALISPLASELTELVPQAGFGKTPRPYASFGYCRLRKKTDRLVHLLATDHVSEIRDRLFPAKETRASLLLEPGRDWLAAAARARLQDPGNAADDPRLTVEKNECDRAVGEFLRQLIKTANWDLAQCESWLETVIETGLIALEQLNLAARAVRAQMADLQIKILLGVSPPATQDLFKTLPSTRRLGTFGLCVCLATAATLAIAAFFAPPWFIPLTIGSAIIVIVGIWAWINRRPGAMIRQPGLPPPGWKEQLRLKRLEYAQLTGSAHDGLVYYESIDRAWAGIEMLKTCALTPEHQPTRHPFDIDLLDQATAREWMSAHGGNDELFVAFLASPEAEQLALDFCRVPDLLPVDNIFRFCVRWVQERLPSKMVDIVAAKRRSGRKLDLDIAPPAVDPALPVRNRALLALCPTGQSDSVQELFAAAGLTGGLRLCEIAHVDDPEIISLSWGFNIMDVMPLV